jgi:hypothetical protein
VTPEVRERVFDLYRAADAAVAAHHPICQKSGRCCRFTEYGHTLFLSDMEAEILLEGATITSASRDTCPFQIDGLCTAREQRPLACRIYFCDVTFQDAMRVISEDFTRQLKQLADEEGRPWRYAPLHTYLEGRAGTAPETNTSRVNLLVINQKS